MIKGAKFNVILLLALFLFASFATAAVLTAPEMGKYLKNENRALVGGQKFIDYGEYDHAKQLLSQSVMKFPRNSMLLALYGKSLYLSGDKKRAEVYLMKALSFNPENALAQNYIEHIRLVRELTESEEAREWSSIMKDKIGDLIVFILSVWVGTSLNSIWGYFLMKWKWRKAKQSYALKDYDDVVHILEA
ncbi:MAG: hypothetical protein R8M38_03330, partial [Mariprofundaceae bacterium]